MGAALKFSACVTVYHLQSLHQTMRCHGKGLYAGMLACDVCVLATQHMCITESGQQLDERGLLRRMSDLAECGLIGAVILISMGHMSRLIQMRSCPSHRGEF